MSKPKRQAVTVPLRLPKSLVRDITKIAKLAGASRNDVTCVILALAIWRRMRK